MINPRPRNLIKNGKSEILYPSKYTVVSRRGTKVRILQTVAGTLIETNKDALALINAFIGGKKREDVISLFDSPVDLDKIIDILIENKFLLSNEDEKIEKIRKKYVKAATRGVYLNTLYLNVANTCNFACRYCYLPFEKFQHCKMSKKVMDDAINMVFRFANQNKRHKLTIRFFGGEPLLNWSGIQHTIKMVEEKIAENSGINVRFIINTNGSLITPKKARYLSEKHVTTLVSLDGLEKEHNKMRVFRHGTGTFNRVMKGIRYLLKNDVELQINTVVGEHNVDNLIGFVKYLNDLGIDKISFNYVRAGCTRKDLAYEHNRRYFGRKILVAIRYAESLGMQIGGDLAMLKFKIKTKDFSHCYAVNGGQLGVEADGFVYPCPNVVGDKTLAFGQISGFSIGDNFRYWSSRVVFNIPECKNCEYAGICCGGCAVNPLYKFGTIYKSMMCGLYKFMINNFIWDI